MAFDLSELGREKAAKLIVKYSDVDEKDVLSLLESCEGRDFEVANVLFHARDKGKLSEYIENLRKYHKEHLGFVHPDIRRGEGINGAIDADIFFRKCYKDLGVA